MQADGSQPDNSGSYPRIQRFIDRHQVSSPAVVPLMFGAWMLAAVASVLNLLVLRARLRVENAALEASSRSGTAGTGMQQSKSDAQP